MIIDIRNTETIKALKEGNNTVFAHIYKDYYRRLYLYAIQYLSAEECEEIVQDTMVWLWENRATLLPEMSIHSLLFTIVKNKCLNRLKQIDTHQKIHDSLYDVFSRESIDSADHYDYKELKKRFEHALSLLPEEQRRTFVQNRFHNKSYQEIADLEGISAKTVAYRISQSLKLLRVALKDYLPLLISIV